MTYFLIKWDISRCSDCGQITDSGYQIFKSVKTIEEAREWVAKHYNENYPPYAIEGEKIEFDFDAVTTATVKIRNKTNEIDEDENRRMDRDHGNW